jgi:beta-galactosidase
MYVPGPWLHAGQNEFVIFDLLGPTTPEVAGLSKPILNELRPYSDFDAHHRPQVELVLDGVDPTYSAQFAPGSQMQEIHFNAPKTGRYFCLEGLDAQDGKPFAAIAELDLLGPDSKPINHEGWTIAYVDSEERAAEDGSAENAIDGQTATFWHTEWSDKKPEYPHRLVLDLGQPRQISGFRYVPRQGPDTVAGRIKDYRIFVGDDLIKK